MSKKQQEMIQTVQRELQEAKDSGNSQEQKMLEKELQTLKGRQ